ncbi:MAG: heavy-metal-associated domain-containing protein [Bacteroidota bacterium]
MQLFRFKTNFKCQGCINAVHPYLEKINGIQKWEVIDKKDYKELKVEADVGTSKQDIIDAVQKAGYEAIEKKDTIWNRLFG